MIFLWHCQYQVVVGSGYEYSDFKADCSKLSSTFVRYTMSLIILEIYSCLRSLTV